MGCDVKSLKQTKKKHKKLNIKQLYKFVYCTVRLFQCDSCQKY